MKKNDQFMTTNFLLSPFFLMGQMGNEKRILKRLELPEGAEFRTFLEMEKKEISFNAVKNDDQGQE